MIVSTLLVAVVTGYYYVYIPCYYGYRLGGGEEDAKQITAHPFFASINWDDLYHKRVSTAHVTYMYTHMHARSSHTALWKVPGQRAMVKVWLSKVTTTAGWRSRYSRLNGF